MIYFIDESFLRKKVQPIQNVDGADLGPFVSIAIKTYIQKILGYNFLEDLLVKFNDGNTNADEDKLIDFIKDAGAFYTLYEAVPFISFRISNKGVITQSGEFSQGNGVETVEYIRAKVLSLAKRYEDELRKFLDDNKKKYPLYLDKLNKEIQAPDRVRDVKSFNIRGI
jgi:hypothetical protein